MVNTCMTLSSKGGRFGSKRAASESFLEHAVAEVLKYWLPEWDMALHTLSMLVDDGHNVKRLSEAGWSLSEVISPRTAHAGSVAFSTSSRAA